MSRAAGMIAAQGLRYKVEATGTSVEGDRETILDAIRAIEDACAI